MQNKRFYFLVFSIILVGLILIGRLFILQILKHGYYEGLAVNQHQTHQILFPQRGEIFLKDRFYGKDPSSQLFPLAINKDWPMVYAIPKDIQDKESAVKLLAPILEMDEETLRERINKKDDPYEPLKSKISQEVVDKIKELNIKGIEFNSESWRYYPNGSLACHVIGFVGFSEDKMDEKNGQYGIEAYYNKKLGGEYGFLDGEKDTKGRLLAIARSYFDPAEDGADLILTIDPNIQFFVEGKLKEIAERSNQSVSKLANF